MNKQKVTPARLRVLQSAQQGLTYRNGKIPAAVTWLCDNGYLASDYRADAVSGDTVSKFTLTNKGKMECGLGYSVVDMIKENGFNIQQTTPPVAAVGLPAVDAAAVSEFSRARALFLEKHRVIRSKHALNIRIKMLRSELSGMNADAKNDLTPTAAAAIAAAAAQLETTITALEAALAAE